MNQFLTFIKTYYWIPITFLVLILNKIFHAFPSFTETFYSSFIFQAIRFVFDYTLGLLPFPPVYLLFFLLLFLGFRRIFKIKKKSFSWMKFGLSSLSFVGMVISLFYILWGFNYARVPFETKAELNLQSVDSTFVWQELQECKKQMEANYPGIDYDEIQYAKLEKEVRADLKELLQTLGYAANTRVRGRKLNPKGILLRISTAGVYIPFVAEGHIDGGLHPSQWPFVMAHEMSHAYGFGDEAACNFIAFLACIRSENKFIRYSAWMGYNRYVASNYRRDNPEAYLTFRKTIDPKVIADINAVNENLDKYPDIMPKLRDAIYGS